VVEQNCLPHSGQEGVGLWKKWVVGKEREEKEEEEKETWKRKRWRRR
jgi:hypothetical protein